MPPPFSPRHFAAFTPLSAAFALRFSLSLSLTLIFTLPPLRSMPLSLTIAAAAAFADYHAFAIAHFRLPLLSPLSLRHYFS